MGGKAGAAAGEKSWLVEHTGLEGGRGGGKSGGLRGERDTEEGGRGGGGGGMLFLTESEVLEDSDVDEEEMDTEDSKDDFLSGTRGFGLQPEGDMDLMKEGTGVPAVGVLDWLEYPLDGEVKRCTLSGEDVFA